MQYYCEEERFFDRYFIIFFLYLIECFFFIQNLFGFIIIYKDLSEKSN